MNLIKENCNHIDNDLKTWAKNVKFEPVKENIRLELNEIEGADNLKLVAFINASELQCSNEANVYLSYLTDPNDERSSITFSVRVSMISEKLKEIVDKKRFKKEYLATIKN
jgi:hypothetical protein